MEIKDKIQSIRTKQKITQKELAEKIGVSQATITKIETGLTKYPNVDIAIKIANALGTDVNFLFSDNKIQPKSFTPNELKETVLSAIEIAVLFYVSNIALKYDIRKEKDTSKILEITNIAEEIKNTIQSVLVTYGFCTNEDIINTLQKHFPDSEREEELKSAEKAKLRAKLTEKQTNKSKDN